MNNCSSFLSNLRHFLSVKCKKGRSKACRGNDHAQDEHGSGAFEVQDTAADKVAEHPSEGNGAVDISLSLDLIIFFHDLVNIVGGNRDKDRISEHLEGLADIDHGHIDRKEHDKGLDPEEEARKDQEFFGRDLLHDDVYESHGRELEESCEADGVAH